jgi:hypothetical protein
MKRDMELIRLLLLLYEGEEPKPDLSSYSESSRFTTRRFSSKRSLSTGRFYLTKMAIRAVQ